MRWINILLVLLLLYVALGLLFHFQWKKELNACRQAMIAQGDVGEPEVFNNLIGLGFDVAFWPLYATANWRLDGTIFSTPCTH